MDLGNFKDDFNYDDMFSEESEATGAKFKSIPVERIRRYAHNRVIATEDVSELKAELEECDWELIHPIVVRTLNVGEDTEHDYELIAGERRWTAFKLGGQEYIDARVHGEVTEKTAAAINIVENVHNKPEKLHELAVKCRRFVDEFNVKKGDAAKRLGMESAQFSRLINHVYKMVDIPEIMEIYDDGKGIVDAQLITALVKIRNVSEGAMRDVINFANANNCLSRRFVEAATKLDFGDAIDPQLQSIAFGSRLEPEASSSKAAPQKSAVMGSSAQISESLSDSVEDDSIESVNEEQLELSGVEGETSRDERGDVIDSSATDAITDSNTSSNEVEIDGEVVEKRPLSKAEIAVAVEGKDTAFTIALDFAPRSQDKVAVKDHSGNVTIVDAKDCRIIWIA